jgi:peptide deformylase
MKHIPVLSIVKFPDPRLLEVCAPVAEADFDEAVRHGNSLVDLLVGKAIGLSAPQIAVPWRMFAMYAPFEMVSPVVCINPRIVRVGEVEVMLQEGCLSFPTDVINGIQRPKLVHVEYTNRAGKLINTTMSGWQARIFQHELDHLDGKMFFEHWTPTARKKFMKRMGVKA